MYEVREGFSLSNLITAPEQHLIWPPHIPITAYGSSMQMTALIFIEKIDRIPRISDKNTATAEDHQTQQPCWKKYKNDFFKIFFLGVFIQNKLNYGLLTLCSININRATKQEQKHSYHHAHHLQQHTVTGGQQDQKSES